MEQATITASAEKVEDYTCPACQAQMLLDEASHEVGISLAEAQRKAEDLGCWGYWKFDSPVFKMMVEEAGHGVELKMHACPNCDLRCIEIEIP